MELSTAQITAHVPEDLIRALDGAARRLNCPRAEIMRRALKRYLSDFSDLSESTEPTTEEQALQQVEGELKRRGWLPKRTSVNSPDGDVWAYHPHRSGHVAIEVKGLRTRSAVWLKEHQVKAVKIVIIVQLDKGLVWVLSKKKALRLLHGYQKIFYERHGRRPAAEGFNVSQLPEPTGWAPLDRLL